MRQEDSAHPRKLNYEKLPAPLSTLWLGAASLCPMVLKCTLQPLGYILTIIWGRQAVLIPENSSAKIACSHVPIGSGAASHHLMVLKYTLYSWVCISAIIPASYLVPNLENSTAKNCLISSTHWIGGCQPWANGSKIYTIFLGMCFNNNMSQSCGAHPRKLNSENCLIPNTY